MTPRDGVGQSTVVAQLRLSGVLSDYQAQLLFARDPNNAELGANPYVGDLREHTRAYLDLPNRQ